LKILFRTAGGKAPKMELGLGHIFRSINLAKEFRKNDIFFLIEDYGGVKKIILKNSLKNNYYLKKGINLELDLKKTAKIIKNEKIDVLVIDHYHIQNEYVKKMKEIVKVVVISDLEKIDFPADLVINGFVGFKNKIIKNKFNTKCLLGPKYQILKKNFDKKPSTIKKKFLILGTFGGYDEQKISEIILEELLNFDKLFYSKIILGPVSEKSKKLKQILEKKSKKIEVKTESYNMKNEILSSKFGFCTGGLTTYEFASMNVPFAIICDEKHQLKTAREWEKRKIAINLGMVKKTTKTDIKKIILQLIDNQIKLKQGQKVVDGKGSLRVSNEIVKIIERNY
jgi:UDP-2,4-diacetamido-2,4,6-trideoxy-beta-L-altropyranose hydrolase